MTEESKLNTELNDDEEIQMLNDLKGKKKKKCKKCNKSKKKCLCKGKESKESKDNEDNITYDYRDLLSRIYNENMPSERKKISMQPPQIQRVGTRRTLWANFQETCSTMKRKPEHVFKFFLAELGTDGSIDGNSRFVIKGNYQPKYIESLLRKYIAEYVTCQMCRGVNTDINRDSVSRMHFMHCNDCGASRSVAAISKGFHATGKGERRAARNSS